MSIVTTIISLAHSLNLRVVAEGVETDTQARLLFLLKCEEAQGYLFSKPLPAADIESKWLQPRADNSSVPMPGPRQDQDASGQDLRRG
jgi:EAL domain-containing protein (putative c-di-GMP-specific phosphodiesterase class I)